MHIDTNPSAFTLSLTSEADAAQRATTVETKQENAKQISELRDDANDNHVAEHIRGMVAATMSSLANHATDTTRSHAEQWQQWALGMADGLEMPVVGC